MKDTNNGEEGFALENTGGTVFIRIAVPDLKVQKCLQFQIDETVWKAKQRILAAFAKDLRDALNYGLFLPPANGRAGKFMEEERTLSEYPIQGPIGFLEFKYKHRVYKMMQISERKHKQIHSKAKLKVFLELVRAGNTSKISKLTLKGLDPNFHDHDNGETPLTSAVTLGKTKVREIIITLISGGAHIDFRNKQGLTALHRAAIVGNSEAIRTMLDLGASPDCKDGRDLTPLYYSVFNDDSVQECTYMLLHERASIGVCDEQHWYEIHQVCKYGRVQHLEHLLFYGADLDVRNSCGNTPLHICALNNQEACARVLLFRGADPTILNYNNQTADQAAALAGNAAIATMITSHNPEDVVPYREIPQFSDRRKGHSLTPSLRALMRSRSDPRINIIGLDSRSTSASSSPRLGQARRQNMRAGMVDWDSACSLSVSSAGSVTGVSDQGIYEGKTFSGTEGYFPGGYVSQVNMRKADSMDNLDSISRAVNKHNTLGMLTQVNKVQKPRVVLLHRSAEGYGFVLRGAKSKLSVGGGFNDFTPSAEYPALQYLDSVDVGSQADRAGLRGGDFILEINGENVVRATHEHVVHLIRTSSDVLTLKVVTVTHTDRMPADWFVHPDSGAMTLPTRKKLAAPLPPQRDPRTSLSYSKGSSRSMAEGLAEIEKLDATIAQFDRDDLLHLHRNHPRIMLAAARDNGSKDFRDPAETRIRNQNKISLEMMTRSKSTPDILTAVDHEYNEPYGSYRKGMAPVPPSHNIYSSGTLQPSQARHASQMLDSSGMYNQRSLPGTPELPQRRPGNQLTTPEIVRIHTGGKSSTYANVSAEIEHQKNMESHYESSFRPGIDAKLVDNPQGAALSPEQMKSKNISLQNEDRSISFADERVMENAYKFLQKYPNASLLVTADIHVDKPERRKSRDVYEPEPDYNYSDEDDKPVDNKTDNYRKTSLVSVDNSKLNVHIDEPRDVTTEGSSIIQKNRKNSVTVISITSSGDNKQAPPSSSHSSPRSTNSTKSSPLPIRAQDNITLTSPAQSLSSSRRSSGVVMVTPSQLSSAESSRRSSIQSNLSGDLSDKNSNYYSLSSISTNYTSKSEDSSKSDLQANIPAAPPCPPLPPPPPPFPVMIGSSQLQDGSTTLRQRQNNVNIASVLPNRISQEDILAAVLERQNRLETEGPRLAEVKAVATSKSTHELNQEAIKAAVAKRKSRLEQDNKSFVHEIEARLNQNKKLQSAKYFGSHVNKHQDDNSKTAEEIKLSAEQDSLAAASISKDGGENSAVKQMDKVALFDASKQKSQVKLSPVAPIKLNQNGGKFISENNSSKIESTGHAESGGTIDFRAHLRHVDTKVTTTTHELETKHLPAVEVNDTTANTSKTNISKPPAPPLPKSSSSSTLPTSISKPKTELNISAETNSDITKPLSGSSSQPSNSNRTSADYVALAEKARLEYLKKKASGNLQPEVEKKGPVEITRNKKSGQHGHLQVLATNTQEMSSSKHNNQTSIETTKAVQDAIEEMQHVSVHDRISRLQVEKNLANDKARLSGVTEDHSHTEMSLSNGTLKKARPNSHIIPPPGKTSTPDIRSKVAPLPPGFGISSAGKGGGDSKPKLNNTNNILNSASRVSISDLIIPPPPPPPLDFSDSTFPDDDAFIPPPPEFLEIDSNANESKASDKNFKPFLAKPVSIWSCGDVLDWLDYMGLPQYRTSFDRAFVDGTKLVDMGKNDFLKLGVRLDDHCRNLEQTVKKLNQGISTNL